MNNNTTQDMLIRRMDVIIHLLLEARVDNEMPISSKIERLLSFGLSKPEVASIIGKPINYVTAVTSGKKKQKIKDKGK